MVNSIGKLFFRGVIMKKFALLVLCMSSFFSAVLVSCEVGLGKAVDTVSPTVEIEEPSADFIVRDEFVMSGTCSDDQGVASIKITLKNTSTKTVYGPFDAEISGQNDSWTCEINPFDKEEPIPDGTYEASAVAKDAYGRATTGTKTFSIDNTPPLLVLTRPSTKVAAAGSEQNFDTYGAEFDITGQVADDSNVDKLVVSVYSDAECTNLLKDIQLNNVPPTIELAAAKWNADENDELFGFYEEIYGFEKTGTKQFYCTVTVYDEARHCPSVENDEGNSRTAYYLYKDIYSALLNKYKVTELYHILNGSYKPEESKTSKNASKASEQALSVEKITDEVNAVLDSCETKAGSFTLNPENSPTFTLSGFDSFDLIDAKTSSEKYQKITEEESGFGLLNGSAVTVKFSAGLDKSPLVEESLGFCLVPWVQDESDGTWSADLNDKIWIIRPYEKDSGGKYTQKIDVSDFESGKQAEAKTYYENARKYLTTVGSYDFTATMNIASSNLLHIKTGNVYELRAVGCDENGNSFLNDSRYGFYLQSSGLAPSISVTEIDGKTAKSTWFVAEGNSMKIKGTVSAEDKTQVKIKVTDNEKNTVAFTGKEILYESSDSPVAESWELEIPNEYFESTKDSEGKAVSSNYTVNITATCGTRSAEKEISVGYDVEGPEIEIASVLPYASLAADGSSGKNIYTVNGKFSVKVRASDSFYKLSETENIVFEIFDSEDSGNQKSVYYFDTGSPNFEKEIDSRSDLKDFDKHNLKIVVTAYDYAGNKTVVEQQIYLDQDTDKPSIELQNAVTEDRTGEGESEKIVDYTKEYPSDGTKNVFLSAAELSARISDDDGIESVSVNLYKSPYKDGDKPVAEYSETVQKSEITSNPYLLAYKLPTESEEFRAEIIVKDTENGTESISVFFLKIDSGAPTLKTFYQIQGGESSQNQKTEMQNANSVAITKAYRFIYEASGNYGLSKTEPVKVKVCKTDSSGNATELDSSSYTNVFSLNGTDGKGGTGTISVSANSSGQGSQGSGIQDDGTYSYEITVTDSNGKTTKAERFIVLDTASPEISVVSPDEDTEWITASSNRLSINGTATDDNGVKSVYYKARGENESLVVPDTPLSDSEWTKLGWKKANGTSSWKIADYELSEGSNRIAFAAVDIYGNCSCKTVRDFKYDGKSPEIAKAEVSKYSDSASGGENQENVPLSGISYLDKSVKKIRFKVEASDNLDLETLRVSVKKDGTETDDWKTADSEVNLQKSSDASGSVLWTWTSPLFILGSENTSSESSSENRIDDGIYEVSVIVSDTSGQTKTKVYSFTADTKSPENISQTISVPSGVVDNSSASGTGVWHSSASPVLSVSAADATSGIAGVYYMVGNSSLDFESVKNQTIDTPLTKSETEGTFRRSLSLNEGENYIYIKSVDNAGNISYSGASDNGGLITWFVDKTGPEIAFSLPNTSKKLSSKVEQAYEISVTDGAAGFKDGTLAAITLSSESGAKISQTAVVSRTSTTGGSSAAGGNSSAAGSSSSGGTFTVKGTFSAEEMSKITDNSATLTVSLKDACGNERTEKLTLKFDNEAPSVKITNPLLETVNGKITISGTSTDNVSVESVRLYRTKFSSDESDSSLAVESLEIAGSNSTVEAVLLQTFEGSSSYNWSYSYTENGGTVSSFDTTKFDDGSKITLYAVALDSAGNTKTESRTLTIDQDADRPEIKFTNLTLKGMSSSKSIMNKNETIFGTVQDDDGVNEMFVSADGGKTWSENIYDSGSWKYTFTEDEPYKLAFKVIDSENREFVSGIGSDKMLSSPKLYDGSGNKFGYKNAGGTYSSDSDTYVYLQTDTQNPVISSVYYIVSENELSFSDDEIKNYKTSSSESKKWQDKSNLSGFGGKYKYLYWLLDSQDASGISSVSASLGGTDLTLCNAVEASETEKISVFKFDASPLVSVNSNLSLSYSVADKADRKTSGEHNVRVDNAAPIIEIKSHKNGTQLFGSSAVNVKGIADDCEKLYVKVTDSDTTPDANFGSDTADKTQWEEIDEYTSTGSWSIVFGSGTNTASGIDYYSKEGTLNGYYDKLFSPKSSEKTAGTKDMRVWLYGEDSLGNVSEPVKLSLNVNPQGDQPNVSVSYPELSGGSKLTSVGGTVRITGSTSLGTSGDVTVDSVWIQIDPSYDAAGGFDANWEAELSSLMQAGGISETDYKIEPSGISEVGNAIKAKGSASSWNLTINASREFNPADNKNRTMAIRVYAYSSTSKVSNPVIVPFELDPNSPVIGGTKAVSLVQYDKDGKTVIREMPYSNNMWISGIWYLVGSAEDDSGISELKLNGESIIGDTSKLTVADDIASSTSCKNYYFSIPVGSETENDVGALQYTLYATEGSADGKFTENIFSFQYDNKAPELKATDAGYKNELSSGGLKIIQSNGTYTVYGTLNEDTVKSSNQSGFSRVLMFFTRTLNGKNYVVDPMLSSGITGMENALDISSFALELKDGIYWKSYTLKNVASETLYLSALSTSDELGKSVRVGGICRIDDIDYTIKAVDYTNMTVTLDSSPSVSSSAKTACFAVAQVIDNTSYENGTTSAFDFNSSDSMSNADGDQMVEGVSQSGTTWKWSASIDSSLILDGAITMNFVAFDQAGNASGVKQYSGTVSNNAPRIAGVMFGNDDDSNGTVDEDELVKTYSMIYTSLNNGGIRNGYINANQIADDVVIPSAGSNGTYVDALNIKGAFLVRPEIVGGNHGIGYSYKVSRGGADVYSVNDVVRLSSVHSSGDEVRSESAGTKLDDIEISLQEMVSKGISDGINAVFDFTLWDYTDGAEQSASSSNQANSARLRIYANVALYDEESPAVRINPFYWNSKDDNSVFYKDGAAKGHIELEDDWKNASGYDSNASSGEYDGDPKVSGTIKIEGTASDNAMLKELYLTVPGLITEKLVGEYVQDGTAKSWAWDNKGKLDTDGFACQIENTKFDNTGHEIKWTVIVNTEKITGVAANDVEVNARAVDRGKLQSDLSYKARTDSGKESSVASEAYRMDVVPYITGISTSLSSLKKNNPSVYSRTALGHYPVSSDESVAITGFNLKGAAISDSSSPANTAVLSESGSTVSVSDFTSGKITATVNGISSLNNKNSNDASGAYSLSESGAAIGTTGDETIYRNYFYNRQPNGDNNNLLADDIVLDVWEFDSEAAKPINGAIDQPIMKINPADGNLGFAFANGSLFFSMGGKVGTRPETLYSAQYWMGSYDFFTSIGFAYDDLGNTYGTAAGGDCNSDEGDAWCFVTSRWGIGVQGQRGSYDGSNALRLERIGQIDDSSYIINKQRVKSPSFATAVHGTSTNVYLAYYDVMNDEIRFKYGTLNSSSKTSFGNFSDSAKSSSGTTRAENVTYVNLLAGGNTGRNAGEYVSLGVVPGSSANGDVVVAVWYDSTNRCLKYAYNAAPLSSANGADSGSEWTAVETVFSGDMASVGEYCEVIVDKDGGIHIAAYDPTNLDLVYAYKSSYNASGFTTCIVDGNGVVGSNLTLDIAKVNDVWTPYIGYYATSCVKPKLAYKVSSGTAVSGTIDDSFTGDWECAVVPTSYATPLGSQGNNRMNVGVWKNSSTWVIKNSTTGTASHNHSGTGYKATCNDTVYGNGTQNPVMGYAIKINGSSTYIETAQMK